tara:strand:+ start:455 stop:649 length:195 start_codon:yes stop_codon:yes gene_type:complete
MEKKMSNKLAEFKQLVADHDVYYSMSDDHKVWQKGYEQYQAIMKIFNGLSEELQQEATKIWENR